MREVVGVVDVGVGNVAALCRALSDVGAKVELVRKPSAMLGLDALVLPGVGSFDHGVTSLKGSGLWGAIQDQVLCASLPILGICLGMQLLGDSSEEGQEEGLGFIAGEIRHIKTLSGLPDNFRIPNMGWSRVEASSEDGLQFLEHTDVGKDTTLSILMLLC